MNEAKRTESEIIKENKESAMYQALTHAAKFNDPITIEKLIENADKIYKWFITEESK